MSVSFIFTPSAITVVLDGRTTVVPASSLNFEDLKVALRKNSDETAIKKILNIKAYVAQVSEGLAEIVDGSLYFDGVPMDGVLAQRVALMFAEGFGVLPLMRFLNRVTLNPRKDIAEELYPFLESGNLPITEDGYVLAYKMIRHDFTDLYTGLMYNYPGSVLSKERYEDVDSNRNHTCSRGLHFASLQYIESGAYGGNHSGNRLVMLKIDPADIVSIPVDYNRSKGRAWKYEVVRELEWSDRIKENFVDNEYTTDNYEIPVANKAPAGSKLTEEDVVAILDLLNSENNTITAISKLYDISTRQVARIRDGEAWSWVPRPW